MATALLHEAAEELPTLGTSLGLGSQVALPLAPLSWGRSPGSPWARMEGGQPPRSSGTELYQSRGARNKAGSRQGQTDLQTGCQKQERKVRGGAEKERKEESLQPGSGAPNTQSGELTQWGKRQQRELEESLQLTICSQRGGDTPMGEEVAEGTKGWRVWGVTAGHRLKAPGQSREEVRGDPKLRQNVLKGTAEAKRGCGGADITDQGHTWLQELGQVDPEANRSWLLLTFKAKELYRVQPRMRLSPRESGESGQRLQGRWHLEAYRS